MEQKMTFNKLRKFDYLKLYAGDVPEDQHYNGFIGLSLERHDYKHIKHNLIKKLPLKDNTVDIFQSEDVFEHINIKYIKTIVYEIYRVLKPGGFFRMSVPDYRSPLLINRSLKNEQSQIVFDPMGGGEYINGKVCNGGHVWFPKYELVKDVFKNIPFSKIEYLHYFDPENQPILKTIDYSICFVQRTPDNDDRVQNPRVPLSIVVDCYK